MTARGTSNGNASGSSEARRRRKRWLLETYAADRPAVVVTRQYGEIFDVIVVDPGPTTAGVLLLVTQYDGETLPDEDWLGTWAEIVPACRCYRCGTLLTFDTVTVDRIIPGCQGGTYRRTNIRPCCGRCNSITGNLVRWGKPLLAEYPFTPPGPPEWTLS